MRRPGLTSVASVVIALAVARGANAEVVVGGGLELVPTGTFAAQTGPREQMSFGIAATAGIGGAVGYRFDWLSVALAARFFPDLHTTLGIEGTERIEQLDLGVRLAVHPRLAPRAELIVLATPGYSVLLAARRDRNDDGSLGTTFTVGGGVRYAVMRRLCASSTVSYLHGNQRTSDQALAATRLFTVALSLELCQ